MSQSRDAKVIDTAIRLLFLGGFCLLAFQLVAPLFGLMIWAVILAVAVYPAHAWLSARLGGRSAPSALLLTLLGLAITLGPVAVMAAQVIDAVAWMVAAVQQGSVALPSADRLAQVPLIGARLVQAWDAFGANLAQLLAQVGPVLLSTGRIVLGKVAGVGIALAMLSLSVIIMGLLFRPGPALVAQARRFANRLFAPRGAGFVDLAGATVRNVSRGVIGVAVIQALLAGIIMVAFGVPLAGPLTLVALVLGIVQIGPGPVLIPVIIWAWFAMATGWAVLFTIVMLPVMVVDNVLRPMLMARGLETPMLVILVGVLGGMFAYGLIGLFIGPVILAVFYELVTAWVNAAEPETVAPPESPGDEPSHLP
ncbi:AI-2E family transporter [Mangrovicoccus algicola]|uniref:AI-2E family transporter n=1 Tax=Mangrovicoccus algicola TaxID=2771008 RepID=A0A8J6YSJ2_9RHOB|nr:AI-2E family transporter [Mangrovicoccus algicola]MBE3636962.1 AI-2E family transporter [Mangrovicoccus algicola]